MPRMQARRLGSILSKLSHLKFFMVRAYHISQHKTKMGQSIRLGGTHYPYFGDFDYIPTPLSP